MSSNSATGRAICSAPFIPDGLPCSRDHLIPIRIQDYGIFLDLRLLVADLRLC
jgi:hypothetical protein